MSGLLYIGLKQYCRLALWFYFKKWQTNILSPIPTGPVIFVANHQNAFLDAVLVGCSTNRNPWFLARANVFEKKWAQTVLGWLKMKPVFRFRDGFGTLRKNDEMLNCFVELLKHNESILIFAEGNHDERWHLRALQKGFARISLAAVEKNVDVKIVPVGIQYEAHAMAGSRVLVSFGESFSVNELTREEIDPRKKAELILEKTSNAIKPLLLDIPLMDYEKRVAYFLNHRIIKKDLVHQLAIDQNLILKYETESFVQQKTKSGKSFRWNPISMYFHVNHFLAKTIIRWILENKVNDDQFIGSLKFALGMVIVPLFYIIQTTIVLMVFNSKLIALVYFLSLPITLLFKIRK